jgi:glycosyltransferase involved in cell wall biosynthesis
MERVFEDICSSLPDDIDAMIVRLPFASRGLLPRLRNLLFTARLRADLIHVTGDVHYCALAIRRSRCILTVHDLSALHRLNGLRRRAYFLLWFRFPTWWAAAITTISKTTRDELVGHLPARASKVFVVPNPVSADFLRAKRKPREHRLPQVLVIGTRSNKNLERLVAALDRLPVHLRIVGSLTLEQQVLLERSSLSYSAVEGLTGEEVVQEYAKSDLLTFLSTYEGFGLPIIEAQAIGLPVISSNLSAMPEAAGKGALLVDPFDTRAIRNAVALLLESPDVVRSLVSRGRRNVQSFHPEAIAAMYAEVYRGTGQPR